MSRPTAALALLALLASSCGAEAQICGRMDTLCGTSRERCHQVVVQTRDALGEDGVTGLKQCFAQASSCSEATGCTAGLGLKAMGDALKGFFKGLGAEDPPSTK